MAEMTMKVSEPVFRAFELGLISREQALSELKRKGEPYASWTGLAENAGFEERG